MDLDKLTEAMAQALESIRVHTWLSKEFTGLAYEDQLLAEQIKKYGETFVA